MTALLYYHGLEGLSTLFFNFPGIITEMLVFRALEEALVAIQWRNPNRASLLQLRFLLILYSIIHYIWERAYLIKGV